MRVRPSRNRLERLHRRKWFFSSGFDFEMGNYIIFYTRYRSKIFPKSFQKSSRNRGLEASWGVLEASWAILGILGILAGCISRSGWASWRSWGPLGVVLGATCGRLGPSWGVSWGILGSLVASGRRLRLGFLPRWSKIEPFHLESHFVFDCLLIFH